MKYLWSFIIILGIGSILPAFAETLPSTTGDHQTVVPVVSSDSDLMKNVQDKIAQDGTLTGTNITVHAEGGIITLEGTATSQVQITEAINVAQSVPGVKEVRSNLMILPPDVVNGAVR